MAVSIGGIGSIWGGLLGAGVVIAFPEVFRQFAQARLLFFGVVLVLIMVLRPQGVWPETGLNLRRSASSFGRFVEGTLSRAGRRKGAP
jgi:ABC-type branched-subunit amino acid transport system permease subunit